MARFTAGEVLRFGEVELHPRPRRSDSPGRVRFRTIPFGEAVRSAAGDVDVERTRREANVVRIRFDHADPGVAEATVLAFVQNFIRLRGSILERESDETVDSLRVLAERTRAEVTHAEAALESQQSTSGLVAPDAQSEVAVQRLADAEVELETSRENLAAVVAMLERAASAPAGSSARTALVAHPLFLDNETMGSLLTRLMLLEERRTELAGRRTENSLEYRTVVEQMRSLDDALRAVAVSYRTALRERIAALEVLVAGLRAELAAVPALAVELGRRQRDVRLLSELLIVTEQRLRQEELRQALTFSNVQVIDPPELQFRPIWPRKKLGLVVGMAAALGFAALAMVVVESADATVRSASELSSLSGAPVLAALASHGRMAAAGAPEAAALLTLGGVVGAPPPLIVAPVEATAGGQAAEEVRNALAAAGWEGPAREVQVAPPLVSYAAALQALAPGGPVLLVVVRGRTPLPDVERAVRLLREAGGGAAGTVVLCRSEAEADELWT